MGTKAGYEMGTKADHEMGTKGGRSWVRGSSMEHQQILT